jgi:hypothetical protein
MKYFRCPIILPAAAVCLLTWSALAEAQQRPLATEDPESIGAGRVLIEGGLEYGRDQFYPASGLTGNLTRFPVLGVSVGISSVAEVQIDGGLYDRLAVEDRKPAPLADLLDFSGDTSASVEDLVIATKVRVAAEAPRRPAVGLRFGTKLPLAPRDTGLGLGTTDFFAALLVGKTVQSVRTVGNVGIVMLEDPFVGGERDSSLTLGISIVDQPSGGGGGNQRTRRRLGRRSGRGHREPGDPSICRALHLPPLPPGWRIADRHDRARPELRGFARVHLCVQRVQYPVGAVRGRAARRRAVTNAVCTRHSLPDRRVEPTQSLQLAGGSIG